MLASYEVSSLNDAGAGSLRQAIIDANNNPGLDEIVFNIAPGGQRTIQVLSVLPGITDPVHIRGETQPGYAGRPLIGLDGSLIASPSITDAGLRLASGSDGSSIKGLSVTSFVPTLIEIQSQSNSITSCFVGVGLDGAITSRQATYGLRILNGAINQIGGADASRNLISGSYNNVAVNGTAAINNRIQGNRIGTTEAGDAAISGTWGSFVSERGILVSSGAANTLIGGDNPGEGNLVSGHFGSAIDIYANGSNQIAGNFVGTDAIGSAKIGNFRGIVLNSSPNNIIRGNLASGNLDGIFASGAASTNTVVQGNLVGTNAAGTTVIGNQWYGIRLTSGVSGALIGGTSSGLRNVVSGNGGDAIYLNGSNLVVQGNYIGTDITGNLSLGNGGAGVYSADATDVRIGGGNAGEGNLISGNVLGVLVLGAILQDGIRLSNVRIQGNFVGTNADGTSALPNSTGIRIAASGGNFVGTDGDGTNDATERNLISGNTITQVDIVSDHTEGNVVAGNWIGLNASGLASIAGGGGVSIINGAGRNRIGTDANGMSDQLERNVIAAPAGTAVFMENTFENVIAGNWIGTNALGTGAIGSLFGITISQSSTNRIGGTNEVQRNVISGITNYSVQIAASSGNEVLGNYVGTDISGKVALGTGLVGVIITASGNVIGGNAPGAGNVIVNQGTGIFLDGVATTANRIQGNYVGVGADGTTRLENVDGIYLRSATANTIGGASDGEGNIISGNSRFGILLGSTSGNTVQGNRIGTDKDGMVAIFNTFGIGLIDDWNSVIGGTEPGAGNLISGNFTGITLYGGLASRFTRIQGNLIGSTANGLAGLGNAFFGIDVGGLDGNRVQDLTIGGTEQHAGNIIAATTNGPGIRIRGTGAERITIQGNLVGLGIDGAQALGNNGDGIYLESSSGHVIGGTVAGARNVISANLHSGLHLFGNNAVGNLIQGNYLGTDRSGSAAVGNGTYGVWLDAGANNNTIGGSGARSGNLISGNLSTGVYLEDLTTTNNVVAGNWIGLNASGTGRLPNVDGIAVSNASGNQIGGTTSQARNIVSGNNRYGLLLSSLEGNHVLGNFIGTNPDGTSIQGTTNAIGIYLDGDRHSHIGGTDSGAGNVIGGSTYGIWIGSAGGRSSEDIRVLGNQIGTNAAGTQPLANSRGILIDGRNSHEIKNIDIGSADDGGRNLISGNTYGVEVVGSNQSGIQIQGNWIGVNSTGQTPLRNYEGIVVNNSPNVTIGGGRPGEGNVISGNSYNIRLAGTETSNTTIQGNLIGLSADGRQAVTNGWLTQTNDDGIVIHEGAHSNLIGGPNPEDGNFIGGHWEQGIWIFPGGSDNNVIENNFIGTNIDGSTAVGNLRGVIAQASSNNVIRNNLISGNYFNVDMRGPATGTVIAGNRIGTNRQGSERIVGGGNNQGIRLSDGISGTRIGGPRAEDRNTISGNDAAVYLYQVDSTAIENNHIGTNSLERQRLATA